MTSDDDGSPAPPRRIDQPYGRRSRTVAGIAGLAAIVGAGAYLTTSLLAGGDSDTAQDLRVVTPAADSPSVSPPTGAASAPTTAVSSAASAPAATSKATTPAKVNPDTVRQEIMAARKAAEKDGFPVHRPLKEQTGHAAASGATSETTRRLPGGGTMRITTAAYDLSGRRPLSWAADDGKDANGSKCTQKFHFSEGDPGTKRPTMLLCWRTSERRSVAVLSVDPDGKPSVVDSTAVVDREWKKLG
jgi:hypothetical protein